MSGFDWDLVPKPAGPVSSPFRTIKTDLPAPESLPLLADLKRTESRSMHGQMPVIWARAVGSSVFDFWGNRWIDFTSTIFVANAGHSHPHIAQALQAALGRQLFHTYAFVNKDRVEFLKKLLEVAGPPFQKGYLVSAGTEAAETVLKLMRLWGMEFSPRRTGVISFQGAMHGRTMGAEFLKGNPESRAWIGHEDPHVYHLPVPAPWTVPNPETTDWEARFHHDMSQLERLGVAVHSLCGFFLESYIGWGAIMYPPGYIQALARFAKEKGMLLAFDEIQGGFGRTGKMFAFQHYGVEPDLICLGKGMSSCLPLAGVLGRQKIMDLPNIGSMSSTHSANPLSCAAGLANLEVFEKEKLVEQSARKGLRLHERLLGLKNKFPNRVSHVLGQGLLAAILVRHPKTGEPDGAFATAVCDGAMRKGLLLVHTGRESIKIGPPLSIPDEMLEEGLDVLEEAFRDADLKERK